MTGKLANNIILGCVTGAVWLGVSVGILAIIGVVHIDGRNQISMLWLWMISAFLNTVMQEMLVRGYLYQMLKSNCNIGIAVIVSTGLFTFAHGGAFEAVYGLCGVDRAVPEVWGSTYDIRELVESSVRLMDGKSPLDMELPKPLNMVKNAVLKKIKGTDIEKLLKEHGVLNEG